ncbi:DEAD/DEAH box helicase family protein [Hymenobacter sp. DH14]|uniref:DEAD/DEAH box helicase family protein n=1 Tax=Hymenobacter cyanobacteriorum TaxID=2926463 RepID=A0A9X1VFM4_9BACT|nr:DEAD/DEAH box helicase family protein [Hymenobacter cyanobacteriorum]MCI1188026.1 DEAD/DEAH box helicase family protein [Hymenobacter cyanobacteriorum]
MFAEEIFEGGKKKRVFYTSFEKIVLHARHLDASTDLVRLAPFSSDTSILNFQVGTGKTHVLFDYIGQYLATGTDFTIFYCAPFLRLLNEITRELSKRGISYFDCTQIDSREDEDTFANPENFDYQVQLMTPDFLLGSGGKKSVRQALGKSGYKDKLRDHLLTSERKVVLIVDEIHEKTSIFSSQHLPELLQWTGLVHKAFIASATFTADAVEVSKAVSFLTGRRITVFQADRIKGPQQARLHLHICTQEYGEKDLHPLAGLEEVIKRYPSRPIHILTAYKSIAQKLATGRDSVAAEAVRGLVPRPLLLTSDNKTPFNETKNSIGTTFKTGVNIVSKDGVLIAILPGQNTDQAGSLALGTFTDMRSSVVQAFARLRNGGDLHVFMPPFDGHIRSKDFVTQAWGDMLLGTKVGVSSKDAGIYIEEDQVLTDFDKLYTHREKLLAAFKAIADSETGASYDMLVKFEGRYDFVLSEYPAFKDAFLDKENQGLPSLILWMAVHDQFINCSLETVTVEKYVSSSVKKAAGEAWAEVFKKSISGRLPTHKPTSSFKAIETLVQLLDEDAAESDETPLYGVKKVRIQELVANTKDAADAVLDLSLSWLSPDGSVPKKKDWFTKLVHDSKPWDGSSPVEQEDYYSVIKSALNDLATETINTATLLGGKLYLRATFDKHLSEDATQLLAVLANALKEAVQSAFLLNIGAVHLPGFSTANPQTEQDYVQVGLRMLRQALGLVGKQPSRIGRKDLFGVENPHYLIAPIAHL